MDFKEKIEEIVEKVTKDEALVSSFKEDPIKTVEKVAGVDLPDDVVDKIVDAIKAKVSVDKAANLFGSIKKLF